MSAAATPEIGRLARTGRAGAPVPGAAARLRRAAGAACCCLAAAVLTGCLFPAMGPNYKRPAVPLPTAWRIDLTEAAGVVNTEWWTGFGDENLNLLIAQALAANTDILIATARVQQYDAKLETTNSQYFPQLGYDVGLERDQRSQEVPELLRIGQPITFNQWKYLATVSYEVDLWGRVRRSFEGARAQLLSTAEARHTVMLTVVTSVASTYVQLLQADRQLEIAQQTMASLQATLDLTDKKYHGGSATDIDVATARAELEDQAAVIPDIERSIAALEDSLSTLIGHNPGSIPRGRLDKLTLMPVPGGVPADVLTRRPDILSAEQDLVAANATIGIAKTEYFPNFSLTSSFGQSSDETQYLLAMTARTGVLAIDFIGPIFTFGKVEGDVKAAKAVTRAATQKYLQTIQNALREVDDALVFNQKSRERLAALDRHVAALEDVDRLAKLRYRGGSYTDLDVYSADRRVLNSQNEQLVGVTNEYLAMVSVFKAMGGGWMVEQDRQPASKKLAGAPAGSASTNPQISSTTKDVTSK